MHTITHQEARQALLALSNAIQQADVLFDTLESAPEGLAVAAAADVVAPLYVRLQALRVAYGYTPDGLLLKAPKGWDMIEAGLEPGQLPAMLRPQAA